MGFLHSWIAVQALQRETALDVLGMEFGDPLGAECLPDGIAMGQLPGGWLICLTGPDAHAFEGKLVELAALGPAVGCDVNEMTMCSEARGYFAGEEIWRVVHDPDGEDSLEVTGSPPAQLEAITNAVRAEQESYEEDDVDLDFDVPAKLAESICGFMLGVGTEKDFDAIGFVHLCGPATSQPAAAPGFFARLFGRG